MMSIPNVDDTPREVPWSAIGEFDQLDVRVSAITVIFGSVIGVNDGSVEWCPDDMPPSEQERLAWIWLCHPSLASEIAPLATGRFRTLITAYRDHEMERWWRDLSA